MKMWIRKAFVIFVTIITFGIVVPPVHPVMNEPQSKEGKESEVLTESPPLIEVEDEGEVAEDEPPFPSVEISWQETADYVDDAEELAALFTDYVVMQAEHQAKRKFGPVIDGTIGDQFSTEILPEFQSIVQDFSTNKISAEELKFIGVSERPTGGHGEKILHLYSLKTGQDLIRFHVRRDSPPQEGYWFNFHYHDHEDRFLTHHELGKIYWDKNTPPKWLS